ncbi:potassium-transporting ATPase subunit C [Nocardioides anomalus]
MTMKTLYDLWRQSLAGLRLLIAATLLLGLAYPAVVYGFGRVAAPWEARGSLVTADGSHTEDPSKAVGSAILGQVVDDDRLFQPRPSAAGDGYDTLSTYGSNLGPEEPALIDAIEQRRAEVAEREGVDPSRVPPDALTASASGLDPDISVAYAELQVPRVAAATGLSEDRVRALVEDHTSGRTWGVLGEPHVNVLTLDIAVLQAAGDRTEDDG